MLEGFKATCKMKVEEQLAFNDGHTILKGLEMRNLLNQACTGCMPGFLKLFLCRCVCMCVLCVCICVCVVCVCVSALEAVNNLWRDMDPIYMIG